MNSRFGLTLAVIGMAAAGLTGCSSNPTDQAQNGGADPADSNFANAPAPAPAAATSANYPAPAADAYSGQANTSWSAYQDAPEFSGQEEYAQQPPPPIPDYSQPDCPGPNYIWTPGYWSYTSEGYYWVPGAWVLAPYLDALWTPPYWAFDSGRYRWHAGYWGPHIGYYGGINYGFGYTGNGYYGGYWNQGNFVYNNTVNNVNASVVRNVYRRPVSAFTSSRVSYNGGPGGVNAQPTRAELAAEREPRIAPVPAQITHAREAAVNRSQFASVNRGRPATMAAAKPLAVGYRSPSAPPAAVQRTIRPEVSRPGPEPARGGDVRAQLQPAERSGVQPRNEGTRSPVPEQRPAPQPAVRPNLPAARPEPAARPQLAARPEPAARPQPAARPEPAARSQPAARPEPAARPQPAARPEPAAQREITRPQEIRSVPAARPQEAPRPQPAARPAPAPRPSPAARPAPAAHPAAAPRKEDEKR